MVQNDIREVAAQFCFEGELASVKELTAGLINNSYHLSYALPDGVRDYVLQQINSYVFKKPEEVMSNVQRVTEHLHAAFAQQGVDSGRRALRLIHTIDGGVMHRDGEGRCWRAYDFITDAITRDRLESAAQFGGIGRAFGQFQRMLADFPAEQLYDTIPDFHNTPRRFETFMASVRADRAGRAAGVQAEIDFLCQRQDMMRGIVDMIEAGEIPLRVTHNDTKANNVMLDAASGEVLCVVDLDTVMPGSVLYDFGDAIRYGASTAAEDEPDTGRISIDLDYYRAFAEGFVSQVKDSLTVRELKSLPLGAKVMTCELAMRFLTDYLDGDVYFKTAYPEHNLVRARAQMKLLSEMEAHYAEMCASIQNDIRK